MNKYLQKEQGGKGTSKKKYVNLWLSPLSQHLGGGKKAHSRMKDIREFCRDTNPARGPTQENPGFSSLCCEAEVRQR